MNWKLRLLAAALALPLTGLAQSATPSQSPDQPSTPNTANARNDDRGDHHDYGWIGLVGLAGLAGLRRKHAGEVREIDRTRRAA